MGIDSLTQNIANVVKENPVTTAVGVGVGVVGAGLVGAALIGAANSRKNKRKRTRKGISRDRKFISREKHERRYKRKTKGKRYKTKRMKSGKRVYYAKKTGQPYILLSSGKAKFIKGKRRLR